MLTELNSTSWSYGSRELLARQHHPGGVFTLLLLAFSHFHLPSSCPEANCSSSERFLDRLVYLSQMQQGLAYQMETEHYRRWRSRLNSDGRGGTMCALYWQLNDIWAAPSWSSIDVELNWKPAHYFVRRSFQPVIVSMYIDDAALLRVFVVSDLLSPIEGALLHLDVFTWGNGFSPISSVRKTLNIPAMTSFEVNIQPLMLYKYIHTCTCPSMFRELMMSAEDFVVTAALFHSNGTAITLPNSLLPDKLYKTDPSRYGQVTLSEFEQISSNEYRFTVNATDLTPLVWLDVRRVNSSTPLFFDDNAFTMTAPTRSVRLRVRDPVVPISFEDLVVCTLADCGYSRIVH